MTEKLTIELQEDGTYLRSDGVALQPADKNPFYVMATVFGTNDNQSVSSDNRDLWNRWVLSNWDQSVLKRAERRTEVPNQLLSREDRQTLLSALTDRLDWTDDLPSRVNFAETYFPNSTKFSGFIFPPMVNFRDCHFDRDVWFNDAYFSGRAEFRNARFGFIASFVDAQFEGDVSFNAANFAERGAFRGAKFYSSASFSEVVFSEAAMFSDGHFAGGVYFDNAIFKDRVPDFFQRSFHDDTKFSAEKSLWPKVNVAQHLAQFDKDAYRRLRQISAEQQNPENEHFFLRQEMACDAVLKRGLNRLVIQAFGLISDYGYSLWRPVLGLGATVLLGGLLILCVFAWAYVDGVPVNGMIAVPGMFDAFGLGIANTFSIFGFRTFYLGETYMQSLPLVVKLIGGTQTVLGFIFLFFLGLGLRNRFRLK